jgi:hypothetical protein
VLERVSGLLGGIVPRCVVLWLLYETHTVISSKGATMVAHEKNIWFGCLLAASLFVLVLAGCGDVSESGSSQRAQPSEKSPPTETGESHAAGGGPADCKPTQPDMLGPFYEPGAPVRTSVGSGYMLSGAVLGAEVCKPIFNARIEFWLANPRGVRRCTPGYTVRRRERRVSLPEQRARVLWRETTPHSRPRDSARL